MGKGQPRRAQREITEQENVHVDRARPMAGTSRRASELALDRLASGEQLLRTELRLNSQARVQEVGLIEHLALGSGLVHRRRSCDRDAAASQSVARLAEVAEPVALVRAEAEIARHTSFQTSTETSSTGSGIGGSGFVAFTRTDSAPKRLSSRSATAVQSRSRVLYWRSWAARATCSHTSA